ncbi:hypothetical protein AAFC00_001061 [Neodothiora populina]|uniref:Asl1-like glycosyl hydrolase catalytic domain-containing protein n=1 Tax=Neodothiora populina TaxID=2781224 RepID=A0ABR3PNN8_9PEZI
MLSLFGSIVALAPIVAATASSKRGLVYVVGQASDDNLWDSSNSDITWYYNYKAEPTTEYNGKLEFVPMMWGAPSSPSTDMSFYNSVSSLIDGGMNITHVLGFNEPDGCVSGGSCMAAADAATIWKLQFEPLKKKYGVKLGAPAVTGAPNGFTWLANWFSECAALSNGNGSCEVDFIPAHWYGNFEGLASHLGQVNATYQNITETWVTEFACTECSLKDSQTFFNQSTSYFDDTLSYLTRYSYFGAFRSDVSNVGPNAAFLTQKGELTDIGSWYLGGEATGNVPKGSASAVAKFAGWGAVVGASIFWSLL